MDSKHIFMESEGDAYFERNRQAECSLSKAAQFLSEFIKKNPNISSGGGGKNLLEVGCAGGHNLIYLSQNFDLKCYGIEPSQKAVEYGNNIIRQKEITKVELLCGTSDNLPYEDNSMDFVILGFFMCYLNRNTVLKTVAEADRVLKRGGFLVIQDFDVPIPYKRTYKHNSNIFTYKCDCAQLFLGDPTYTLIEKTTYSHSSSAFDPVIQKRVSSSILYKERIEDIYQFDKEV